MTEVMKKVIRTCAILEVLVALIATAFAQQEQQLPASSTNVTIPKEERPAHAAENLYLQLRSNGLDRSVFTRFAKLPSIVTSFT